jgi:hypothetical protein
MNYLRDEWHCNKVDNHDNSPLCPLGAVVEGTCGYLLRIELPLYCLPPCQPCGPMQPLAFQMLCLSSYRVFP